MSAFFVNLPSECSSRDAAAKPRLYPDSRDRPKSRLSPARAGRRMLRKSLTATTSGERGGIHARVGSGGSGGCESKGNELRARAEPNSLRRSEGGAGGCDATPPQNKKKRDRIP